MKFQSINTKKVKYRVLDDVMYCITPYVTDDCYSLSKHSLPLGAFSSTKKYQDFLQIIASNNRFESHCPKNGLTLRLGDRGIASCFIFSLVLSLTNRDINYVPRHNLMSASYLLPFKSRNRPVLKLPSVPLEGFTQQVYKKKMQVSGSKNRMEYKLYWSNCVS